MSKYWEKYRDRHHSVDKMTDRQSYITHLESQMDKASHSVAVVNSLAQTVDSIQAQLNTAEEKIVNLSRLMKLQQSYVETQEQEIEALKAGGELKPRARQSNDLFQLENRVAVLEHSLKTSKGASAVQATVEQSIRQQTEELFSQQRAFQARVEAAISSRSLDGQASFGELGNTEQRLAALERTQREFQGRVDAFQREVNSVAEVAWNSEQTSVKLSENTLEQLRSFERVLHQLQQPAALEEFEAKVSSRVGDKLEKIQDIIQGYRQHQEQFSKDIKGLKKSVKLLNKENEGTLRSPNRSASAASLKHTKSPELKATRGDTKNASFSNTSPKTSDTASKHRLMQAKLRRGREEKKTTKPKKPSNKLEKFYKDITKK